jgi:hypothetical protein
VQPPSTTTTSGAAAPLAAAPDPAAAASSFWTAAHGRAIDPDVLHRVLGRVRQTGPRGLVLFDLDSTLLDNKPRQARIVREFGAAYGIRELTLCTPAMFVDWSLRKPMLACGLPEEQVKALEPEARRYWRERFFTSAYCVDDGANPGAQAFVARILEDGAQVLYCTGRHTQMREGTLACFTREGFPLPDQQRVHLLMKPSFELHDDDWKVIARRQIAELGELLAAFDNEPTHINSYHEHFPDALCVHLLTDDSARGIPVLPGVISVRNFELP